MKVLKGIAALLIIVAVVFVIAGLLGPKGMHMERSILIHAPRSAVFANISDYRRWERWSPWFGIDSACKYEYYGPQGEADAGYKWSGNDKVGAGSMHTIEISKNTGLVTELSFTRPWKSESRASFSLDSAGPGDTKVTWSFDQQFPFSQRPMMLVMNMEKMLAPDYEKGLASLKKLSESTPAAPAAATIRELTWEKKTYVAYRTEVGFAAVSETYQKYMPLAYQYVTANKMVMAGAPAGLYFTWDTVKKITDMAVAIPVAKADKVAGEYKAVTAEGSKAVEADYYGSYDHMGDTHAQIGKYIADKGLKKKGLVIEEYVTDPGTEKDPNKVLTKIWYLVD